MSEPNTITINDVKYVREGSISKPDELNGMPYVVVRSRDQGVMVGYLKSNTETSCVLLRARQVWSWESRFVLAEFAEFGPTGNGRMSCALSQPFQLFQQCGIYRCTDEAGKKIRAVPDYVAK